MTRALRLAVASLLLSLVGGASFSVARLLAPLPHPAVSVAAAATWTPVPGAPPLVDVPAQGSLAVEATDAEGTRTVSNSDAATVRPIASVTKTMTALVVLEQHPLAAGADGPVLTMTPADVADYVSIAAAGGSVAPVRDGERLSERQLLLGLMLPSANNMALTLARWVDGSVSGFVSRLNSRAVALGMVHTHFADPDGLDRATTSTAADLVILGERAITESSLVDIVSSRVAALPDGTVVHNLDVLLLTEPGWLGIKTGWTPEAGGCLLFAARRAVSPGSPPVTVVGAVLGQPPDAAADPDHPELGTAVAVARSAVTTVLAGYAAAILTPTSLPVSASLHDTAGTALSAAHPVGPVQTVVVRVGEALRLAVAAAEVAEPVPAGTAVASITAFRDGVAVATWEVVTTTAVPEPSAADRLLHW